MDPKGTPIRLSKDCSSFCQLHQATYFQRSACFYRVGSSASISRAISLCISLLVLQSCTAHVSLSLRCSLFLCLYCTVHMYLSMCYNLFPSLHYTVSIYSCTTELCTTHTVCMSPCTMSTTPFPYSALPCVASHFKSAISNT